jgi:hypothetical protein
MITPQQEAQNIYNEMIVDFLMEKWQSKQCALKAVEKIISVIKEPDALEYWNEVKKEINNI